MLSQPTEDPRLPALQNRLALVALLLTAMGAADSEKSATDRTDRKALATGVEANSPSDLLHDLRVACRRAETALKACRHQLPDKLRRWFCDELKTLRDFCNPLRDDEVLRKWVRKQAPDEAQERVMKDLSESIEAGRKHVAAQARLAVKRRHFPRRIQELSKIATESHGADVGVSEPLWRYHLGQWLFDNLNRVLQTIPSHQGDFHALHQLRIAVKRLRYSLEYCIELEPTLTLRRSIAQLKTMQDKLGELHDAVVRLQRFENGTLKKSTNNKLVEAARAELESCRTTWHEWWKADSLQQVVRQCGTAASRMVVR